MKAGQYLQEKSFITSSSSLQTSLVGFPQKGGNFQSDVFDGQTD